MAPSIPRLLVFDLDGTLIDSRVDLCNSVNATLTHLHRPLLPDSVIASYVGDGVSTLLSRALAHGGHVDPTQELLQEAVDFFLDYYRLHKLDYTYVYPGVSEALEMIRSSFPEVLMAVLTNKPVRPSREICSHFGLDRFFFQNYGGNSFGNKKPEPEGLLTLMVEASTLVRSLHPNAPPIGPSETIMLGDSAVDVLTARNAGTRSIGCTFGLSPESLRQAGPDLLAHSPSEWPSLVAAAPAQRWENNLVGSGSRAPVPASDHAGLAFPPEDADAAGIQSE